VLTVYLEDIGEKGLQLTGEADADLLALLTERLVDDQVRLSGPLHYRFRIFRAYDMIEIEGGFETEIELACSRCLGNYKAPLREIFTLTFAEELPEVEDEAGDDEVELSAEEMGITLLEGDSIDLTEPLLENILVALPLQPLCSDGCKGLCPHCGIDLNQGSCSCEAPQFDTRFSALKNFKVGSKGDSNDS